MANIKSKSSIDPLIPASRQLPEITLRAVVLGIILAVLLAASSTFVGLKIARTIAGSIPAALISILILRHFKNANILENNMVQTIASAGETLAAGTIFTIPALVIMGYWQSFNYWQMVLITGVGGALGVLFSVPLRRSMVVKDNLPYPEGVATGEVLKAGESTEDSTKLLLKASLLSAGLSFLQTGFKVAGEQLQYWAKVGSTAIGGSIFLSPVLMAAGYIVGMRGLIAFVAGGFLTWGLAIPIFVAVKGLPLTGDLGTALALVQKAHFRYVGVGILAIGGLWSVISLMTQISSALKLSFIGMKDQSERSVLRTDQDLPFVQVLWGVGILALIIGGFFLYWVSEANLGLDRSTHAALVLFSTVAVLIVSFVASAAAAYIVGIVGTTSLPTSGITIAAIVSFAACLLFILQSIDFANHLETALQIAALVILFAAVVATAAAISGDNMQDLKAGQIVGATPWKQQAMLLVGVVSSALVIPFILQTTFEAYGIGDILPRVGMDPTQALPAPQATLMATVAKGFFVGHLPMNMIMSGVGLGIIAIILDELLKRSGSTIRFPALLFALGVYLPLGYVTAFFLGGLIRAFAQRARATKTSFKETEKGILCASGIIAGEALLGAALTIPFAYYQDTDLFALNIGFLSSYQTLIGVLLYAVLCIFLYKQAKS